MRYRADILELYGSLFDETYAELEKNAGIFGRMGGAVKRVLSRPPTHLREIGQTLGAQTQKDVAGATLKQLQAGPLASYYAGMTPEAFQQQYGKRYLGDAVKNVHAPSNITAPSTAGATPAVGAAEGAAVEGAAAPKKGIGAGTIAAVGIPAAAAGGYLLGRPNEHEVEQQRTRTRNIAFGAGAATGLAAPHIIQGLNSLANGSQGLYPGAGY